MLSQRLNNNVISACMVASVGNGSKRLFARLIWSSCSCLKRYVSDRDYSREIKEKYISRNNNLIILCVYLITFFDRGMSHDLVTDPGGP